jgi:hypothetical protein
VDPYARHTQLSVLEFGATYGSGGIGALVQPLIGERVFRTLNPNRQAGAAARLRSRRRKNLDDAIPQPLLDSLWQMTDLAFHQGLRQGHKPGDACP